MVISHEEMIPSSVQDDQKQEEEPTLFTVKLVKYKDDSKIKLIKEVKTIMEGMNLVQVSLCTGRSRVNWTSLLSSTYNFV